MNSNISNNRMINIGNHSLQAAAKAAAQINAQLAAEGKLQQQSVPTPSVVPRRKESKTKPSKKDLFNAEIEINDLPPRVRNLLTKGYIQEQIQWRSKAALCTKGRFIAPQEKALASCDDRPLYICIQAIEKEAVDEAIQQIQQFISEHANGWSPPQPNPTIPPRSIQPVVPNHPPPSVPLIQDKVYINLDHAPQSFNLLQRVLGPNSANVSYITSETGVSVMLRGQGYSSGCEEPLHLLLEHIDSGTVQNARSLALSLVGTLQQDFVQWQQSQQNHQQHQQSQQPQQLVYITQPIYSSGSTPAGSGFHYPALTMVYGMDSNTMHSTATASREQLQQQRDAVAPKRPSRFDFQHCPGNHPSEESVVKRQKMTTQMMYQP